MTDKFTSAEELKEVFEIAGHSEYVNFTPLTKEVGFSVQRLYPPTSNYKPPIRKDGTPDTVALIAVLYEPTSTRKRDPDRVPIYLKVSVYSRYIANHFDYDFTSDECPTEESVISSKKTPRPVDLNQFNEYFFDHKENRLVDSDGKPTTGLKIINDLYASHLATVDKFKGLIFRWKLGSISRASNLCEPACGVFKWMLKVVCGRTLASEDISKGISGEYKSGDVKLLKTERIDVFGYSASKNVIGTFCMLILSAFFLFKVTGGSPSWVKTIAEKNVLALAASILTIAVLDHLLPRGLLWLINMTIRLRWKIMLAKVTFK